MAKVVYSKPIDVISFKIFGVFDAFRMNPKFSNLQDSIPVILLLVSLYKDGVINEVTFTNGLNLTDFKTLILESNLNKESKETYLSIFDVLSDSLSKVLSQPLEYLSFHLFQIDRELLSEHFSGVIDDVIYRIFQSQGRYTGEFIQPMEITRFIINLANLDASAKVYNPFAGLASFATFLSPNQSYYGQEINQGAWVLGKLRLLAHNLLHFEYKLEDSIKKWNDYNTFDLIVSHPPYGIRLPEYSTSNTVDAFLIENSLRQLSDIGQLICVLPQSFLYNSSNSYSKLRKYLIDHNFIDTIISLPSGILNYTSINICIVVLKKTTSNYGKVRFVDASAFVSTYYERKGKFLNDISLIESLRLPAHGSHIRLVDYDTIKNQSYDLNTNRYFVEDLLSGVRLGDIVQQLSGSRDSSTDFSKHVKIKDLKDDVLDFYLDIDSIENSVISLRRDLKKIEQSCLLLATRWKTIKPTFFKYEGQPIYISNDIVALKIDESKVNIDYLINELHSDYVKDQLKGYRITGVIPMIRKSDLFDIKIELPSIENQTKKYYAVAGNYIKSIVKESQDNFDEKRINTEDENSFLRHQIAGSLKNTRGAFKFIQKILEEKVKPQFPDLYNLKASEELESTLTTYLNIVERDLNSIHKSVNKIGDKIELMDLKIENFDLLEFIKDYAEALKIRSQNFYSIHLDLDENAIKEFGISAIHIEGDKDILRKMFDNIVENAEKHAFTHGINNGNQNKLKIELLYNFEDMEVQIDFCNTGNPLPENMTYDSMTRKGSSSGENSGDGVGTWFIKEVMELHKGKFGFTDETGPEGIDSEYVTSIELTFPIIPAI